MNRAILNLRQRISVLKRRSNFIPPFTPEFAVTRALLTAFLSMALSLAIPRHAIAGAPFITDDPGTVGDGGYEFFFTGAGERAGGEHSGFVQLELNYGAAENLDLHFLIGSKEGSVVGRMFNFGSGGIEIGPKYRFVEETDEQPSLAVFPVVQMATSTHRDELADGLTLFMPLWAQKNWGPWNSFLGGGYAISNGDEATNWALVGWGVKRSFFDFFDAGTELFYATADQEGGKDAFGTSVGGTVKLSEHYNFLASVGHDFHGDAKFRYYAAIQGVF